MNTKQIAWALGILVVLAVIAGGLSLLNKNAPVQESPTTGGDVVINEDKPYYTVKATYPSDAPASVSEAIKADITQFKVDGNLDNLTPEDIQIQGLGPNRKYAYSAEYKEYKSPNTVSYVFSIYMDTLGAHPNGFYRTFTFDLQGKELSLADLFKPNAPYLKRLSDESYKQVVAQLTQKSGAAPTPDMLDTVRIGTSPTPESLQFFYVDNNTLGLLFPPYQVAAYAAGSFEVKIPLSQLKDILK